VRHRNGEVHPRDHVRRVVHAPPIQTVRGGRKHGRFDAHRACYGSIRGVNDVPELGLRKALQQVRRQLDAGVVLVPAPVVDWMHDDGASFRRPPLVAQRRDRHRYWTSLQIIYTRRTVQPGCELNTCRIDHNDARPLPLPAFIVHHFQFLNDVGDTNLRRAGVLRIRQGGVAFFGAASLARIDDLSQHERGGVDSIAISRFESLAPGTYTASFSRARLPP